MLYLLARGSEFLKVKIFMRFRADLGLFRLFIDFFVILFIVRFIGEQIRVEFVGSGADLIKYALYDDASIFV